MKAREIIFLIFFIAAGLIFYQVRTGKLDPDWDWEDYIHIDAKAFTSEESGVIDPPFLPLLKIINAHGTVEIQGTEDESITYTFQKKVWRSSEEKARQVAGDLRLIINQENDAITMTTNRDDFRRKDFVLNFKILVPFNMDIDVTNSYGLVKATGVGKAMIQNRHGEVSASDIQGALVIESSYQDIFIEGVRSSCEVKSRHADIIADQVEGGIVITDSYGRIQLKNVKGRVFVECPHGEVKGEDLEGPVEIKNSYEKVTLLRAGQAKIEGHHSPVVADGITGDLEIDTDYEDVKLSNIQGKVRVLGKNMGVSGLGLSGPEISISSSYRDVDLLDFSGPTTISLSHGNLCLEPASLSGPLDVRGDYSHITFTWPQGEEFPLEARTRSGHIDWNIDSTVVREEKNGTSVVKALLELTGKPKVFLSTTYGDIRIEKGVSK